MPYDLPVKCCLCYSYTFAEIKALARQNAWTTLDQVGAALGCSTGCGLCGPYITRMLKTGETEFAVICDDAPLKANDDEVNRDTGE